MNVIKGSVYIKKGNNVTIKHEKEGLLIENIGENIETIIVPRVYKFEKAYLSINFQGKILSGDGVIAKILNRKKIVVYETTLSSRSYIDRPTKFGMIALRILPKTKVCINEFSIDEIDEFQEQLKSYCKNRILVMSTGYPSDANKYLCAFVHTRVRAYKDLNWNVDVISLGFERETKIYEFEGVKVCKTNYANARYMLHEKKYDKILIHFFNEHFSYILDSMDITNTKVYLYSHGADTMYRDFNKMTTLYFCPTPENTLDQELYFRQRDKIVEKYNNLPNVKWFFVTDWTRKHSEELINIKYNNYEIVPCLVDENTFMFEQKKPELRKKIFIIRKFDNVNTYSIDIDVRVILELSRREFFKNLEFNIYGEGSEHDILLAPLRKFKNVHIYNKFLTHDQIAEVHKQNGIALFATRYDSQAVSSCEAAMSGLVVVSSDNTGVFQEINRDNGTLCDTENYTQYADKIEELYNNPDLFVELSKKMHDYVYERYRYDKTIKKELDIFREDDSISVPKFDYQEQDNILLTIAIPSYNVEGFLKNGVCSLINHELSDRLEVLIINDGSKDNTAKIGKELEELTKINGKSIVKLIDKENGGHGSTINKGIELARGKYFKLMDGDDFFETEELKKLIKILEKENSDIILNNFIEDFSADNTRRVNRNYDFMVPGLQYRIEDLCYPGYGFRDWGPLLSTSTYRTQMLKEANFKITENCFYVDMELNMYTFISAKTISYYPLDLYVYYIGRAGQSISTESLRKNCDMHRKVTINLMKIYSEHPDLPEEKKKYLEEKLILKMINNHYYVCIDLFRNGNKFRKFERELKEYPQFYNNSSILNKKVKFNRFFNGHLILMRWPIGVIKKILHMN